jgi:metal-sulfur cluster biosynthetic enzyme
VSEAKLDQIASVIRQFWPPEIHIDELQDLALIRDVELARTKLLDTLDLLQLA